MYKYLIKDCMIGSCTGNIYHRSYSSSFILQKIRNKFKLSINLQKKYYYNSNSNRHSNNPFYQGYNSLYTLIGLNVLVFGIWRYADITNDYQLYKFMNKHFTITSSSIINNNEFHLIFTSMFSHNNLWHLLSNMIVLYFLGTDVLSTIGSTAFLRLYFLSGISGAFCLIFWPYIDPFHKHSRYSNIYYIKCLGASGAISGITAFSIIMNPMRIIYINLILPIPAAIAGLGFIGYDAYNLATGDNSKIGGAAHIGGALIGLGYYTMYRYGRLLR